MAQLKTFTRYLWLLIPLVGVLITTLFLLTIGDMAFRSSVPLLMIHGILMTAGIWTGCIVIVTWLWRRFPWERSPWTHLILEIVLLSAYTILFSGSVYLIEKRFLDLPKPENLGMEIIITILITYFITAIHESIFFYRQWMYNFSKSVRLERDNIEARYEALRAQVNPHFLFNSLNSLVTMAGDNDEVTEYVQNLSDLLRYSLRSGEKDVVLLRDETEIIGKYASLQQKRFPQNLNIEIDIPERLFHYALPPLVLQMLVENCIKHNVISATQPLRVVISAGDESVTVWNNLQRKEDVEGTGTGLANIRGRYRLLTAHEVEVREESDVFSVTIPLLRVEL
jgi:two-component system, LytTR family, sensor kinase